jgi:hypothetical protein
VEAEPPKIAILAEIVEQQTPVVEEVEVDQTLLAMATVVPVVRA